MNNDLATNISWGNIAADSPEVKISKIDKKINEFNKLTLGLSGIDKLKSNKYYIESLLNPTLDSDEAKYLWDLIEQYSIAIKQKEDYRDYINELGCLILLQLKGCGVYGLQPNI